MSDSYFLPLSKLETKREIHSNKLTHKQKYMLVYVSVIPKIHYAIHPLCAEYSENKSIKRNI